MDTRQKQTVIFLHVPKAAGTTLQRIIERQYEPSVVFSIDGARVRESTEEFKELPEAKREQIRVLKGHMHFGLHEFLPQPCTYITILRDPVDRIISHYYYMLRTPNHYLHNDVKSRGMSLEEYVRSGISTELDNGQTRLLSGASGRVAFGECSTAMLETAKRNLREYFSVVGLSERFDETLILLKRTCGWGNTFYVRENITRNRLHKEDISNDTLNVIEKYNELDIALYGYATKMFEELIGQQSSSFEIELKLFKTLNKICSWRRANLARVEAGFAAYARGDLPAARRNFLVAACRNPLVFRNLGIISILLESLLGSAHMNRYRHWRRRIWTKGQQG